MEKMSLGGVGNPGLGFEPDEEWGDCDMVTRRIVSCGKAGIQTGL
jgi:hypothetical protein